MSVIDAFHARIVEQIRPPGDEGSAEYEHWMNLDEAVDLLVGTTTEVIPVLVLSSSFYIDTVLVPDKLLAAEDYVEDILQWSCSAEDCWGWGSSYSEGKPHKHLFPPLYGERSTIIAQGERPLYLREFRGHPRAREDYVVLNERIAQVLGLHWVERRNAYCKLDELGDMQDIVESGSIGDNLLATIDLGEFEFYMYLTDTALVRLFDVTRLDKDRFDSEPWCETKSEDIISRVDENELHARRVILPNGLSHLRGFQIIRRPSPDSVMQAIVEGKNPHPRQYATFIACDGRHGVVAELSCSPGALASYFVESGLPYETTPAFFRPEVLSRYRQDRDKYKLVGRWIHCRGSWSLRYGVNEAGQVHVYLCDLGDLPYKEQQYWQSFNEEPKGPLSKATIQTDFLAECPSDYDALSSLIEVLSEFPLATQFGLERAIWEAPIGTDLSSDLSYVVTDSSKEWEDQVLALSNIVVEGLSKQDIRKLARELECDDAKLGSLKLLRACLEHLSVGDSVIEDIVGPLETVQALRSRGIAHAGDAVPDVDLRLHHRRLLADIDNSMRQLAYLIEQGYFDLQ